MSGGVLVIGIGNAFRCDDGVGLAVAAAVARRHIPGVQVMTDIGDPGSILDAWTGADLAIVVDAAVSQPGTPGRVRRWTPADGGGPRVVSSHMLGLAQTYSLGEALGRLPSRLVVFTVDVADVGHGDTLTPVVAAAVLRVVEAVEAELPPTESA
ncbi:peptidase M52 [Mycobacterium sp. 852013-50091_SCH5140682]|uniref:hydrogenase maturation protease n=1 Tax=Mycobacterium sp. 852013-50091_SCH5140682 TaxID=1834109 RepID=UPI0007E9917A|nr:hydrogenase maturation protease [Mycobacterium sp. 852013-50091_SCH5140682]OBC00403.1 peptidase M52 [Mycobacterium sp. 852013-50091_SCH5140682]